MSAKPFCLACSVIFLLGAAGHLARLVFGWTVQIDGWSAPTWISVVAVVAGASFSAWGLALSRRRRAG